MTIEVSLAPTVDHWGWPTATADSAVLRLTVQFDPDANVLVLHTAPAGPETVGRMIDILVADLGPHLPRRVRQDGVLLHCPVPFRFPGPRWNRAGSGTVRIYTTVGNHLITVD